MLHRCQAPYRVRVSRLVSPKTAVIYAMRSCSFTHTVPGMSTALSFCILLIVQWADPGRVEDL